MSEAGVTADDKENSPKTDSAKQQIKYNWKRYFRFRPLAFAQFLLAQIAGPESADQQDPDSAGVLSQFRRVAVHFLLVAIPALVILAPVGFVLYVVGLCDPQYISTLSAITLAVFAAMQWLIYTKQCEIMRDQHSTMVKQMAQTDQIIETARLEQRAWINIDECTLKPLTAGKLLDFALHLRNSGNTPGQITGGAILMHAADPQATPEEIIEHFNRNFSPIQESFIVPAGKTVPLAVTELGPLTQTQIDDINAGKATLHFICNFTYVDVMKRTHTAKTFFTLSIEDKGLWMQKNYGSMD